MDFYRITSCDDSWYEAFYTIYKTSFPLHEQRNEEQQQAAFQHAEYHLECVIEENRLLAFIAYWEFDSYLYIEHFAVNPACRGQNIGSESLKALAAKTDKVILLEIDPLIDEVSRKRFHFYERLDFKANPYKHYYPPYSLEYPPHELIVLSLSKVLDEALYIQFDNDLKNIVMRFE